MAVSVSVQAGDAWVGSKPELACQVATSACTAPANSTPAAASIDRSGVRVEAGTRVPGAEGEVVWVMEALAEC